MPVYPCVRCDQLVDTHQDPFCRNCGEKRPFTCSRCAKQINQEDIYQLERLKTKKPLLCIACGDAGEVVECGICKRTLVRSQGKQVSLAPGAKVYHMDCYNKQLSTIEFIRKFTPVFALVGVGVGWLLGSGPLAAGPVVSIICAGGVGLGMFAIPRVLSNLLMPK